MSAFNFLTSPLIAWLNRVRPTRPYPLSDFERISFELKPCDILLVEGRSRVSEVIRWVTQSSWTHAALYIGRIHDIEDPDLREIVQFHYSGDTGDRLVIESLLGHGTIINNLTIYEDEHLRICRPSRLGIKDGQQVIRFAVSRLGMDYDIRQIFDLARFLFPWRILPRRWASSLFQHGAGRSTKTVCSTMIAEAFAFIDFPILPLVKQSTEGVQLFRRNPKLYTPSHFDYSPYFEIIKYPFVDFRYDQDHHLLPWEERSDLCEQEDGMYFSSPDVEEAIEEALKTSRSGPAEEEIPTSEVEKTEVGNSQGGGTCSEGRKPVAGSD